MARAKKEATSSGAIRWEKVAWNDLIPRLVLYAKHRQDRLPRSLSLLSPEDLVSSAIEKTISGTRTWNPERVSLLGHLFGVIKSDLYNEARKGLRYSESGVTPEQLESQLPSSDLSPEQMASNQSVLTAFLVELKESDSQAHDWFVLTALQGLPEAEVFEQLGIGKHDVGKMRRRLRKHIDNFVAQGEQDTIKERLEER